MFCLSFPNHDELRPDLIRNLPAAPARYESDGHYAQVGSEDRSADTLVRNNLRSLEVPMLRSFRELPLLRTRRSNASGITFLSRRDS